MKGEHVEFSLTPCGPADHIQLRTGLMRIDAPNVMQRAMLASAIAWLPLAIVALVRPHPDAVAITFFEDIAAHVRFLLVIPLLIIAERGIGMRTKLVANEFAESGLVSANDAARLQAAVRSAHAWVNSVWVEVILIVAAYTLLYFALQRLHHDGVLFWFEQAGLTGERLTGTGRWYAYVSSPIAAFLFLRWLWRYVVWARFLRTVSRLDLRLAASHPDRVGGLGFVNIGQTSFAIVTLASSCVLAAASANRILHEGANLMSYKSVVIGYIVVSLAVGLIPLLAFLRPLLLAKWRGMFRYGQFGVRYVQSFEKKWLDSHGDSGEPMLGSGDIQSLADLGGGFERVDGMRVVPFDRRTVAAFVFAAAVPMLPLLLTVMPLKEIAKLLIKAMV